MNVTVDNKSQQRSQYWIEQIKQTINDKKYSNNDPNRQYQLLSHKHMVGLLACVFIKNQHKGRVKHTHTDSVGVGVMGMMGNKGDSTLCVVCTQFAAHRENVAGRNSDFENALSKASFDIGDEAVKEVIRSGSLANGLLELVA